MKSETRRLAVVTGASWGIGREIALTLARHGWNVAFSYVGENGPADEVVAAIGAEGGVALGICCDVGLKSEVDAFYLKAAEKFSGVPDLLVNNAGVQT